MRMYIDLSNENACKIVIMDYNLQVDNKYK